MAEVAKMHEPSSEARHARWPRQRPARPSRCRRRTEPRYRRAPGRDRPARRCRRDVVELVESRCIDHPLSMRDTVARSSPLSPITTSLVFALFRCRPWRGRSAWLTRGPTACTRSRIGLPRTAAKPLIRSTPCGLGGGGDAAGKRCRIVDLRQRNDEALEFVMVMIEFVVMMRLAVLDVGLGADIQSEQSRHDRPCRPRS